tara:strand:+ start:449 stop:643 length:195 start_codon:yes stop_codon:yes gene_type:complete
MDTFYLQTISEYNNSRYQENGFKNRFEYLESLREQYGADKVNALLTVLPPSEDFDGLVTELEDN